MVFEEKFFVGYRDIDKSCNIKNSSILNIFEDIAGLHARTVGEGLYQADTTWFVTGYKVKILKRPKYSEHVKVLTWGTEIKNVSASREFEIRNEKNELLVIGLSNWAHINTKTKELEKVSDELIEGYQLEKTRTNFNEFKIKRINTIGNELCRKEFFIDWNWIDTNDHLNNIFYLDIAEMALPDELMKNNDFSSFEIIYKKEVKYKDIIQSIVVCNGNDYFVTLQNKENGEIHAIIKLKK